MNVIPHRHRNRTKGSPLLNRNGVKPRGGPAGYQCAVARKPPRRTEHACTVVTHRLHR